MTYLELVVRGVQVHSDSNSVEGFRGWELRQQYLSRRRWQEYLTWNAY